MGINIRYFIGLISGALVVGRSNSVNQHGAIREAYYRSLTSNDWFGVVTQKGSKREDSLEYVVNGGRVFKRIPPVEVVPFLNEESAVLIPDNVGSNNNCEGIDLKDVG